MKQVWRWFGPKDQVSVDDMLQAGVEGVVTALHHVPPGQLWTRNEIDQRIDQIAHMTDGTASGLGWDVVESLPVSGAIKKQAGNWRDHIQTYKDSLRNLAASGIQTVCYNFMPVLDWTRTDLAYRLPNAATCMRFDHADFAAFDIHVLRRPGATDDFDASLVAEADRRHAAWDQRRIDEMTRNIVFGLPGAADTMTLQDVRAHLAQYGQIDADQLRANFVDFLEQVTPVAAELGVNLCCHPDDPPVPLLGLPRIMSTAEDFNHILSAVDLPQNGLTLCSGSLGARADNDLPAMMQRFGDRVHFLHLRNVRRETDAVFGSFHEAEHLGGNTDMVALMRAILAEEQRRRDNGRPDASIPFRPDHGQDILDDLNRNSQPGYPAIGRLKGLAELRGVMTALGHIQ